MHRDNLLLLNSAKGILQIKTLFSQSKFNYLHHCYMHTSTQFTHLGRRYYSDCNLVLMFLDCYPGMFWFQNENDSWFILNFLRISKGCCISLNMICILIMAHKKYSHFIETIYLCVVMNACRYSLSFLFHFISL